MQAKIVALYRYPVKGLSAQSLDAGVDLAPGETLPLDRAYAVWNMPAPPPGAPGHLPKSMFLCLAKNERLAALKTTFTEAGPSHRLALARDGATLLEADLATPEGRSSVEAFFARDFAAELRGEPRVLRAPGHSYSDVKEKCLHIVNLATVRALEASYGVPLDPLRFRPNVVIDGLPARAELDLMDKTIRLGGAELHVYKRTERCPATNVDPATGVRAGNLPGHLSRTQGHSDLGVYATVTKGGRIGIGDLLAVS